MENSLQRMKELVEKLDQAAKSILPGRQGNHEQSGVRQPVRPAGAAGKKKPALYSQIVLLSV